MRINNTPPFAEEQVINEEQQTNIQKKLNELKQTISADFVELKVEEGNYICSTNSK